MKIAGFETHPAADLFPLLNDQELKFLAANIKAEGLIEPLTLYEGRLLDGRNRALACAVENIPLRFTRFAGGNPWRYAWAKNAERRHLEPFQMAALAVKFALASGDWQASQAKKREQANKARAEKAKRQPRQKNRLGAMTGPRSTDRAPDKRDRTAREIAQQAKVSPATVKRALQLRRLAPDTFEAVCRGELPGRHALGEVRRMVRIERLARIAKSNTRLTGDLGRFSVILADVPYRYDHSGEARAVENHYPTLATDDLCRLPVKDISADDAILFFWCPSPKLVDALRIIEAWSFTYRTSMVWVKDRIGPGYYARQRHELLLVATRGSLPVPAPSDRPDSVIEARRGKHSEKPEVFAQLIERMYPSLPRVELFARAHRRNWASWGNEVTEAA